MADKQQIWTRDLTGADVLRLLLAAEAEIVPPNQRMNPVFWPSLAEGVPIGLILEGVIKYPPIEVDHDHRRSDRTAGRREGARMTADNYESILTALCLFREARGCEEDAKLAVANVIYNRRDDPKNRWPKTLAGVILQHMQFSSFNAGANPDAVFPVPGSAEWPAWLACCDVVDLMAHRIDPTDGAQFYHSIPEGQPWPHWTTVFTQTAQIGPFRFYRED